jgi:hypothetical protein
LDTNVRTCLESGCRKRLHPSNKTGYCRNHAYIASRRMTSAKTRQCTHRGEGCLLQFKPESPNQNNCEVCRVPARKAHNLEYALKKYQADPKKAAKRALTNRHKRLRKAGKKIVRLGVKVPCMYGTKEGKRGDGCKKTFTRTRALQKFCENCRKLANREIAKASRIKHKAEIKARDSQRNKEMRRDAKNWKAHKEGQSSQQLRIAAAPAKPGPKTKPEENKRYFRFGIMVEEKVASGMEVTAARRLVAKAVGITYNSMAGYHKKFRRHTRSKIAA